MRTPTDISLFARTARAKLARRVELATLLAALTAAAATAQPDLGQPRSTRTPAIDAQTGEVLNAAIEALRTNRHADARAAIAALDLATLSPYERSRAEQVLFNAAYGEQRYDDAQRHLASAVAAGGLSPQEVSQARYQSAQLLMAEERWREGAAALEDWFATAVTPSPAAHYLLAVAYYQLEELDRALPPAQRAVDLMAEPQEGWLGMLLALRLRNEEYRDAVPLLQKLVAAFPSKKTYWMQLSATYGQLEDYEGALATMQGAYGIGLLTEDAELRRLADLLLFQRHPARAAQVLESAIANDIVALDVGLYEKLATAWLAAGDPAQAITPLTRAAELADGGDPFVRLGEANIELRNWTAAEEAIEQGIRKGRLADEGKAQLLAGIALFEQDRLTDARGRFEQARFSSAHEPLAARYLAAIDSKIGVR
jgi:hypothetical protein